MAGRRGWRLKDGSVGVVAEHGGADRGSKAMYREIDRVELVRFPDEARRDRGTSGYPAGIAQMPARCVPSPGPRHLA